MKCPYCVELREVFAEKFVNNPEALASPIDDKTPEHDDAHKKANAIMAEAIAHLDSANVLIIGTPLEGNPNLGNANQILYTMRDLAIKYGLWV